MWLLKEGVVRNCSKLWASVSVNKVDFIATPTRAEDKEVEYFMIPREVETIDSVLSDLW